MEENGAKRLGFQKGNKFGKKFTSENQPSPEAKSEGKKRVKALKDLAKIVVQDVGQIDFKEMCDLIGIRIEREEMTVEIVMTLKQIQKAIVEGDTKAYKAAMDRLVGTPVKNHEHTGKDGEPIKVEQITGMIVKK